MYNYNRNRIIHIVFIRKKIIFFILNLNVAVEVTCFINILLS